MDGLSELNDKKEKLLKSLQSTADELRKVNNEIQKVEQRQFLEKETLTLLEKFKKSCPFVSSVHLTQKGTLKAIDFDGIPVKVVIDLFSREYKKLIYVGENLTILFGSVSLHNGEKTLYIEKNVKNY